MNSLSNHHGPRLPWRLLPHLWTWLFCGDALVVSMLALILGSVAASSAFFVANDSPQHIFSVVVHQRYTDPTLAFPQFYQLQLPMTRLGFAWLFAPLASLLGWQFAFRVTIIVFSEAFALGTWVLARRLHPSRRWFGLVGFPLALGTFLYLGQLPYIGALALTPWILWVGLRKPTLERRDFLLLCLLLLIDAVFHLVPAALAGVALLAVTLARAARPVRDGLSVVLCGAPAAALCLAFVPAISDPRSPAVTVPYRAAGLAAAAYLVPGHVRLALLLVLILLAIVCIGLSWRLMDRTAAALVLVGLGYLLVSMMLPNDPIGWQHGGGRALPFGVILVLAGCPAERIGHRLQRMAAVLAVTTGVASLAVASHDNRALAAIARSVIDDASVLSRRPTFWLPVVLDYQGIEVPTLLVQPLLHASLYVVMQKGGGSPYTHSGSPRGFLLRTFVRDTRGVPTFTPEIHEGAEVGLTQDPVQRHLLRQRLIWRVAQFRNVILFGGEDDRVAFEQAGYEPVETARRFTVLRFAGCGLAFDGVPVSGGLLHVAAGDAAASAHVSIVLPAKGLRTVVGIPCGPIDVIASPGCPAPGGGERARVILRKGEQQHLACGG